MSATETLRKACERILGGKPEIERWYAYERGGARRGTMRVRVGERTLYATRRKDGRVTAKEARVLKALCEAGGPVPRFLGYEEGWLLAEDAGRPRLSERLAHADADAARDLLDQATDSLVDLQRIGRERRLADVVVPFAQGDAVASRLVAQPESAGEMLGLAPPERDVARQHALLATEGHAFVKWDARPGNATLRDSGEVVWFDFQHCNRRWPADDFVWLLCDETVPPAAHPERRLADLAQEHDGDADWAPGSAMEYVATLGTAHVLVRLGAQLDALARGALTTWEESLLQDWNGAPKAVAHLLRRGAAVSAISPLTAPLEPWFRELLERHRH